MRLNSYLRRFQNIAWYPSACRDIQAMVSLSFEVLMRNGIRKEEIPDCFLFTDYDSQVRYNDTGKFVLDLEEDENQVTFGYENTSHNALACNVRELDRIRIPFHPELVTGPKDEYYGRVFTADIFIEHPEFGKIITKLVYVVAENTSFCFDYLLRNHIRIKYAILSRYGHGFGGGFSSGLYMYHVLRDLGVKYFASDMSVEDHGDVAYDYLSREQRRTYPILREICDFSIETRWWGYNATKLYEVMGFREDNRRLGFFDE